MVRKRPLGRTGLVVSELGLGCSSFWAKPLFSDAAACGLVEAALDRGITFFDTGPSYASGNAERRLGLVLRGMRSRGDVVVASKVGVLAPVAVRDSVARSLDRLGLDHLDVLHLHGPAADDLRPELLQVLADLKQEGLVRCLGINTFDRRVVHAALGHPLFDSFMIQYNVINKRAAADIDAIAAAGRAVVVATPLAQALFSLRTFFPTSLKAGWETLRALGRHRPEWRAALRYRFLSQLPGISGAQAALAYVLRHPAISCAVFGTTSQQHLVDNIAATRLQLPDDVVRRIEQLADVS